MKTRLLTRWCVTILTSLALTTGLAGCIGTDDIPSIPIIPGLNGPPSELVDTWTISAVTLDGQGQDLSDWFEWQAETASARLVINDDYSQHYQERDAQNNVIYTESGNFAVDGQNLTLTVTEQNGSAVSSYVVLAGTWLVADDALTLTEVDDSQTVVISLTR